MLSVSHWRCSLLAAVALLAQTTGSQAEGPHHFNITNNSQYTFRLTDWKARCVQQWGNSVNWPWTINPGQTYTVNWEDSNNIGDYNGYGCTNKDKFVAISFQLDGAPQKYNGYIGITHRNLKGSSWYNGQFYAESVQVNNNNGGIAGSDGATPPAWIQALCTNGNNCFGPWSEMEWDDRDSYNWQRSYQTEDGWAFQINNP